MINDYPDNNVVVAILHTVLRNNNEITNKPLK